MSCFASSIVNGEDTEDEGCNPDALIRCFEDGKLLLLLVETMVVLETTSSSCPILFDVVFKSSCSDVIFSTLTLNDKKSSNECQIRKECAKDNKNNSYL